MTIESYRYKVVDEVLTLTLADDPVIHFLRATWEDDDHTHEVANGADDSAEAAVVAWSLRDRVLSVTFDPEAADELGLDEHVELTLRLPDEAVADIRRRLTDILVDVPEATP